MKKKEALKKLRVFLEDWECCDLRAGDKFGKALFRFLEEEIGMAPPPTEEYDVTNLKGENLGKLYDGYHWEEE